MDFSDPNALLNLMKTGSQPASGTPMPSASSIAAHSSRGQGSTIAQPASGQPQVGMTPLQTLALNGQGEGRGIYSGQPQKQVSPSAWANANSPPDAIAGASPVVTAPSGKTGTPIPTSSPPSNTPQAIDTKPYQATKINSAAPVNTDLDRAHASAWDFINNYKPIQGQAASPQRDFLQEFKDKKQTPAQVFSNIIDALGTAGRFMGGDTSAITRRRAEFNQALQANEEAAKAYTQNVAQNSQQANMSNAELQKQLQTIGPQAQAVIAETIAPLGPQAQAEVWKYYSELPGEKQLAWLRTLLGAASNPQNLQTIMNPQLGGATNTAGTPQGH